MLRQISTSLNFDHENSAGVYLCLRETIAAQFLSEHAPAPDAFCNLIFHFGRGEECAVRNFLRVAFCNID